MFELGIGCVVRFYSYRTAMVYNRFFEVDRYSEEAKDFEELLNQEAGANGIDNHTCYSITNRNGSTLYVICSDGVMAFGATLEERHW